MICAHDSSSMCQPKTFSKSSIQAAPAWIEFHHSGNYASWLMYLFLALTRRKAQLDLCPVVIRRSFEKFMFLVEQAHWYYEVRRAPISAYFVQESLDVLYRYKDKHRALQDFCRDNDPSLKSLSLRTFTGIIFQHCPGLAQLYKDRDSIYARFSAYKQTVPVMGAILLNTNMDKCLLVRGFKNSASWGFPKGKVAKDEPDSACAIREVHTSSSLSHNSSPMSHYRSETVASTIQWASYRADSSSHKEPGLDSNHVSSRGHALFSRGL